MNKTDKQVWAEIGQSMRAAKKLRDANRREQEHSQAVKESVAEVSPAIAPKLRDALEAAKNG